MKKIISIAALGLIIISNAMAVEEVEYETIKINEVYEVRKYSDRLVVETTTSNQNSNFRKLFNYISGSNEKNQEIKMTAPVTQIKKNGKMAMQFYLPVEFNKKNVPNPANPEVKVLNMKGGYFAVITYSGRASDNNFIKHKEILENRLNEDKVSILGPPIRATYNGPFTLPMLRRNEVMFEIEKNT